MSTDLEINFPYAPGTPGADFANNGGKYWRNLTPANKALLDEMHQWVKAENINLSDLCTHYLHGSLLLLRYLRANTFNTKKAKKHIEKTIEWRKTQNIPELMKQSPEEILGCKMADIVDNFPHWHYGYDRSGRPILFKQQGEFDVKAIKRICGGSFDRVIRYHVWEQELINRVCYEQSLKSKTIIETLMVVWDVKGMQMSTLSSDFRSLMSSMIKMDQDYYPETLGKIMIVNAPSVFPMIWGVIKPWLDAVTAAKVSIKGSEYKAMLIESLGMENVPANYGGTKAPLTHDIHPYAQAMEVVYNVIPESLSGHHPAVPKAPKPPVVEDPGLAEDFDHLKVSTGGSEAGSRQESVDGEAVAAEGSDVPQTVFSGATATAADASGSSAAPPVATGGYKQREFIY